MLCCRSENRSQCFKGSDCPHLQGQGSPKTAAVREDTENDTGTSDEGSNKDNVGGKPKGCYSHWTA